MDVLIIIFFLAIIAIPALAMMNIGVWQMKKAGETFGSMRKEKNDLKFFEVQRKFYTLNPGTSETDFMDWYVQKKIEFSGIFGAYDPPRFSKWIVETDKPKNFYRKLS